MYHHHQVMTMEPQRKSVNGFECIFIKNINCTTPSESNDGTNASSTVAQLNDDE